MLELRGLHKSPQGRMTTHLESRGEWEELLRDSEPCRGVQRENLQFEWQASRRLVSVPDPRVLALHAAVQSLQREANCENLKP